MENVVMFRDLETYLKEHNYERDICEYILTSFKTLCNYYEEYEQYDPGIIDFEMFTNSYISALEKVGKLNILRDVNQDDDFVRSMKPTNGIPVTSGYIKDKDGKYIATNNNPEYYCGLGGLTNNITGVVTILFDDNTKTYPNILINTLIHELTHVKQTGFELPWYIMNRDFFIRCLREGNAIREARYTSKPKNSFYAIPFKYDDKENEFIPTEIGDYRLYKYIYFKLEMLLGHDFMIKWAARKDDSTFLIKAYKLIDAKYGKGTFKKLYKNIELIFLGLGNYPVESLEKIKTQQNTFIAFHENSIDVTLDSTMEEYERITSILGSEELITKDYERERASLLSTKQYFEALNIGSVNPTKKIDEKLSKLTKESHRLSLERNCEILRDEIDVKTDVKFFKMLSLTNVNACEEAVKNPHYFTDAIVALESLIVKCLLKDMDDHFNKGHDNYQRYIYYISNMGSTSFNYKVMNSVKKKLNYLSMKTLLGNEPELFKGNIESPKK